MEPVCDDLDEESPADWPNESWPLGLCRHVTPKRVRVRDRGGWASRGKRTICPMCKNDDATLIETVIYGKKSQTLFCAVCASEFDADSARDDDT